MHHKYAKDGLTVISVDIDNPKDKALRERVVKFLKDQQATFTNLVLARGEKADDWYDNKLNLENGLPYAEVYGRDGKLVKKFEPGSTHEAMDKFVGQLLQKR